MVFTLEFLNILAGLIWNGAPLFLGIGIAIAALAIAAGRREGWSTGDSLYYGFITATTVGYGDMTPSTGGTGDRHVQTIDRVENLALPTVK